MVTGRNRLESPSHGREKEPAGCGGLPEEDHKEESERTGRPEEADSSRFSVARVEATASAKAPGARPARKPSRTAAIISFWPLPRNRRRLRPAGEKKVTSRKSSTTAMRSPRAISIRSFGSP